MTINRDAYLDTLFSIDPNLRNDDAQVDKILMALDAVNPPKPVFNPIRVQRVDEYKGRGRVATTWEVVDASKPKGERIVKVLPDEQSARAEAIKRAPIAGGAYVYSAVDTDEPWHDSDAEQLANAPLYNVISGCGLTYDSGNLTVDLGAGAISHTGLPTAVAAAVDAYTLVADGSNERWAALTVGSAGTAVLVSGDAAASASVEPSKPEPGNRVVVGMAKVQAAQTVANNCEYKLDKRIPHPGGLIAYSATATSTVSTSAVDLLTLSVLGFNNSIPVSQRIRIEFNWRKTAAAATAVGFGLKLNATVVLEAVVGGSTAIAFSSATQQAEQGHAWLIVSPRSSADYLRAFQGQNVTAVTGAGTNTVTNTPAATSAAAPNAAITSIAIRAINDTTSNAAEIFDVRVYVDGGA